LSGFLFSLLASIGGLHLETGILGEGKMVVVVGRKIGKYFVKGKMQLQNGDRRCVIRGLPSALHELAVSVQHFTARCLASPVNMKWSSVLLLCYVDVILVRAARGRVGCRPYDCTYRGM